MSKLKVQMKFKAQSRKHKIFDFLVEGKNLLTFSHLSFI
jgi:hypothetical protein